MNSENSAASHVRVERRGRAGLVTLSRPSALNALTHDMIRSLHAAIIEWETDPAIEAVILRGEGRAFSAGGDVAQVYRDNLSGHSPLGFFADEYRLNAHMRAYGKPLVALADGIVMGGGVGISVHGSHRVFTEKTRFAMPEVAIGFFPDVGGSYFLPRLPGRYGYFLALTGSRIGWGDCLAAGIATDCVPSGELEGLAEEICATGNVGQALASRRVVPEPETGAGVRGAIDRIFAGETVEQILEPLERETGEWAAAALAALRRGSPTSLRVTLRQLSEGAGLTMEECMAMEYRIVTRMLERHDFMEGIRAALIDKDGKPDWQPPTLAEVTPSMVAQYFAPLPDGEWQPHPVETGR